MAKLVCGIKYLCALLKVTENFAPLVCGPTATVEPNARKRCTFAGSAFQTNHLLGMNECVHGKSNVACSYLPPNSALTTMVAGWVMAQNKKKFTLTSGAKQLLTSSTSESSFRPMNHRVTLMELSQRTHFLKFSFKDKISLVILLRTLFNALHFIRRTYIYISRKRRK